MDEWQYELAERSESRAKEMRIAQIKLANAQQTHPDFDGGHCVSCGEPVHQYRLSLGKIRCVDCQDIEDRKNGY